MFLKENDLSKLKEFIATKKPHVVAVTAESKEALRIVEEVQRLIQELTEEAEMPAINVELVDNEVAMVYENSNKGQVRHGVRELQQRAGKSRCTKTPTKGRKISGDVRLKNDYFQWKH